MSNIIIHPPAQGPARMRARQSQLDALPPQPARYDINPHAGYRHAYMHGFYGSTALRYGFDPPALRAIKEAAIAAGADLAAVDALTLDQVIVLPDGSMSATVGGVNVNVPWPIQQRAARPIGAPGQYEMLDTGGVVSLDIAPPNPNPSSIAVASAAVPGPIFLQSINLNAEDAAGLAIISLILTGFGTLYSNKFTTGGEASDSISTDIQTFVEAPGTLQLTIDRSAAGPSDFSANAQLFYRWARRKI